MFIFFQDFGSSSGKTVGNHVETEEVCVTTSVHPTAYNAAEWAMMIVLSWPPVNLTHAANKVRFMS